MHIGVNLAKLLLKIRYRVEISGLEYLDKDSPNLILPTHIALIEPVILWTYLREKGRINPVVVDEYYNKVLLKPFFKSMGAIEVADLVANEGKELDVKSIMGDLIKNLNLNHNILLYPQGEMARQGFQSIIGKKTAYYAVQQAPERTKILTVNIQGLRGSRSSWARTGTKPHLLSYILKGLFFSICNLLFFVPKRTIKIEIKDSTKDLRKYAEKGLDSFNQELEKIYNVNGEEKIKYISGLSWYNTVKNKKEPEKIIGSIADFKRESFSSSIEIPKEVLKSITTIVSKIKPDYNGEITLDTNLILDCFFDSLDMAELKSSIQSKFSNASNPPLLDLKTVGDVAIMALGKSASDEELKPCNRKSSNDYNLIFGHISHTLKPESSILSMMKEIFKTNKSYSFCYDNSFGVQSKNDFLIKAYLIADLLKQFPGEKIAIMLPSLSATSLLVTGCYLAKKVPVMLNWTLSNEAFDHCLASQNVKTILTAKAFFNQIQNPHVKKYNVTFIEDLLSSISLGQKIKAVIKSKAFVIPNKIPDIAVVLFTSGSESLPKAVELTHQNILHDLYGAVGIVGIKQNDTEICFLPPFHSFGFTLGVILPLISGIKIVFTPDPNDSSNIAKLIKHTNATILASTPTFLRGIVQSSKDNQLDSLRVSIVGAEKCPEILFSDISKVAHNSIIIEGYGITECSPVISVNPLKKDSEIKRGSVGLPILGESIKILDLNNNSELPSNKEGMIFIHGKNIFNGYIDKKIESPFYEINGEKWYRTGDLGYIDDDGYLYISGRLKRFVKIAGEMISLPAIEDVLSRKWKSESGEQCIAIEYKEENGKTDLVLCTTEDITVDEVNNYLHKQGVTNLIHINSIKKVDSIPILGTGKVDHIQLSKIIFGKSTGKELEKESNNKISSKQKSIKKNNKSEKASKESDKKSHKPAKTSKKSKSDLK